LLGQLKRGDRSVAVLASEPGSLEGVEFYEVDIGDEAAVRQAVALAAPEQMYHLAAVSSLAGVAAREKSALEVNVWGTRNVAAACASLERKPRLLNVSTSQVYAETSAKIEETMSLAPANLYGASKQMAEIWLGLYRDLDVVTARSFNHTGPGQTDNFVLPYLVRSLAEIEAGAKPARLFTGNIDVERDFTDVRDVVRAYHLLMERGRRGEVYNVCSGKYYRIADLLDILRGLVKVNVSVEIDPARYRVNDAKRIWGCHAKLSDDTGWTPEIPIEKTLADMLEYWRVRVRKDLGQTCHG
jgi:GDP-4-dehydro-6-deoxy-D-mannose reductase